MPRLTLIVRSYLWTAALLCGAVVAHADSVIVAPNANASTAGNAGTFIPFSNNTWTFQWQIAASQLTPMAGSNVNAIGFRLGSSVPGVAAGENVGNWALQLSGAANSLGGMTSNFAANVGSGATTVHSGGLTLPELPGGATVNGFFLIPFTTLYHYTGGDLLVTLQVSGGRPDLPAIDGVTAGSGGVVNTVGQIAGSGVEVGYYNAPITGFRYAAPVTPPASVPEPAAISVLLLGGILAFAAPSRRKI